MDSPLSAAADRRQQAQPLPLTDNPVAPQANLQPGHKKISRRYPSNLRDEQWARVRVLLPLPLRQRKSPTSMRAIVDALNYRWSTGCPWRMLPHDFPPWETVYAYYQRWGRAGCLTAIQAELIRRSTRHKNGRQSNDRSTTQEIPYPTRRPAGDDRVPPDIPRRVATSRADEDVVVDSAYGPRDIPRNTEGILRD